MPRFGNWIVGSCMVAMLIGMLGCSKTSNTPVAPQPVESETSQQPEGSSGETDEMAEAFAGLSEEDRALAKAQKVCPVGGGPLGSMGTPYKVELEGKTVFLCCDGCEALLKEDPEKYLAKLASDEPKE